jgi:hypothetical protein
MLVPGPVLLIRAYLAASGASSCPPHGCPGVSNRARASDTAATSASDARSDWPGPDRRTATGTTGCPSTAHWCGTRLLAWSAFDAHGYRMQRVATQRGHPQDSAFADRSVPDECVAEADWDALLKTKLAAPLPHHILIARPALVSQMTTALLRPLTLISAPWVRQNGRAI